MSAILPPSAMRRVTCAELRELAAAYRVPLMYAAARCARETKVYLHWTAGHYGQFFADYHVQIDADGVRAHAPYGPRTTCERWDLEYLGTEESPVFAPWAQDGTRGGGVLRGKAQYYREHGVL